MGLPSVRGHQGLAVAAENGKFGVIWYLMGTHVRIASWIVVHAISHKLIVEGKVHLVLLHTIYEVLPLCSS